MNQSWCLQAIDQFVDEHLIRQFNLRAADGGGALVALLKDLLQLEVLFSPLSLLVILALFLLFISNNAIFDAFRVGFFGCALLSRCEVLVVVNWIDIAIVLGERSGMGRVALVLFFAAVRHDAQVAVVLTAERELTLSILTNRQIIVRTLFFILYMYVVLVVHHAVLLMTLLLLALLEGERDGRLSHDGAEGGARLLRG